MVGSTPEQEHASSRRSVWRRHPGRSAISAIAVVLVIGFGVWWFAVRDDNGSAAVTTTVTKQLVTVTRGPLTETISAEGTAAAAQTDSLSFGSSGTVTAVNVAAGDKVTAGQVLATIDSASLQSAVDSAQSDLADAEATLADDQSSGASSTQIAVDESKVQTAQDSLTEAQTKLAGATLTATFAGTVTTVNVTAGEQLGSSGSGGTGQTGSDSGSGNSSSNLGSGSQTGSNSGTGNSGGTGSSSSTPDIEVVSVGHYTSNLEVDSSQVDSVKAGAPVTVTVSSGSSNSGFGRFGGFGGFGNAASRAATSGTGNATAGNGNASSGTGASTTSGSSSVSSTTATGTVTAVGKVADASSGVAEYPVTIDFSTDEAAFSVGTSISGAISSPVKDDVIQVPIRAVSTQDGTSTVTVALDGKANGRTKTVDVTTGQSAGGEIEITKGLQEGQQVVVENVVISGGGTTGTGNQGGNTRQFPGGGEFPGGGQFPGGARLNTGGGQ